MEKKCYPRLRQKGQVTIPQDIRDELELGVGERIELTVRKVEQ